MSFFAFILMPFEQEYDALFVDVLVPILREYDFDVERADTTFNQQNIMKDVVEGIAKANLVIADLTNLNPNVFYELGIAHSFPIRTILLTQDIDELPFDLRSYRVIEYSNLHYKIADLKIKLHEILKKFIDNELEFGNPVTDYIPEKQFQNTIKVKKNSKKETPTNESGYLDFIVDGEKSIEQMTASVEEITEATKANTVLLNNNVKKIIELTKSQKTPKMLRIIIDSIANDLRNYSKKISPLVSVYHNSLLNFESNISNLFQTDIIKTVPLDEILNFHKSLNFVQSGNNEALIGVKMAISGLNEAKGISQNLSRSIIEVTGVLGNLENDSKRTDAIISKLILNLNEIINLLR